MRNSRELHCKDAKTEETLCAFGPLRLCVKNARGKILAERSDTILR